ncbi:MAG: hypothetical protein ACUVTE_07615 [Candidatus Bathycorpusculaceae bacterium]
MKANVLKTLLAELGEVKERLKHIEENMITKDDLESLIESFEILSENPKIVKEIDKAIRGV